MGLTVATGLAFMRHEVVCADIESWKIKQLSSGIVPIFEEGLPELIKDMVASGRLSFTASNLEAIDRSEFIFLCLPTPTGLNGEADLSATMKVASEIAPHLTRNSIVVNKSTVPVGTTHKVRDVIDRTDVDVVANPEFLSEGSALLNFLQPDRIVIGSDSRETGYRVAELYGEPDRHKCVFTDTVSAELIKYASNAYLATRVTFINTIAEIAEAVGADIRAVANGMGLDPRIGGAFLNAGPGWGGSCFPKDTEALIHMAQASGSDVSLIEAVVAANTRHTRRIEEKIANAVGGSVLDKVVAVWGLAFKAGTNDLRSSPALKIVSSLQGHGALVRAYDPTLKESLDGVETFQTKEEACEGADVLLIATEWSEFSSADLTRIGELMSQRAIVDARNVISFEAARRAGFDYIGVGQGQIKSGAAVEMSTLSQNESIEFF